MLLSRPLSILPFALLSTAAFAQVAMQGRWSAVTATPVIPVGAAVLPDGKVLIWSSYDRYTFGANVSAQTLTAIFDPATGTSTERMVTETAHDMFCPGTSYLADGRLLITGGDTPGRSSIYNPGTATWTSGGNLNLPRGYQGQVTIDNGRAFVLGGSWSGGAGGKNGEVWWNNAWTYLPNALASVTLGPDPAGTAVADRHPWLFALGGGKVLHAGPSAAMNLYDLNASGGQTTSAGNRSDDQFSQNGTAVMYDIGKILKVGGSAAYDNATATAGTYIIDVASGVAVSKTGSLRRARGMHNAVVLPNGEVMVVGGMPVPATFSDTNAILVTEIWNPATGVWRDAAAVSVPRNYHSTALLLPDGRVFSGGGGLCGAGCSANHSDVQIYSPSYLFNADGTDAVRPTILSAPATATHGSTIDVSTNGGTQFVLIRYAAVTHTVNSDQRRIPLAATQLSSGFYRLTIPDGAIAMPGNYMLFALNAQGVPSIAKTINVQPAAPTIAITSPVSNQAFVAPATISIQTAVTNPRGAALRVDFYNGSTLLGQATASPYSFSWTNVAVGSYTIRAVVTDDIGLSSSATVNIVVNSQPTNRPPVLSLTSPANNATFTAPASVVIAASASDPDGNLAKVEFFQGTTKLGEATAAPFTFTWNNVLAGSYTIRVVATDAAALTAEVSAAITVTATAGKPPAVLQSLKGVAVPEPASLSSFVTNRAAAIALGKALFWDVQVSSDNKVACASCHFQAGADVRSRNQSNPGVNRAGTTTFAFSATRSGAAASGPDYRMKSGDFPQYELSAAGDANSSILFATTDLMGSQGVRKRTLTSVAAAPAGDVCSDVADAVFGTSRQSTGRNAPTVINAAFNLRNFHDGRANSVFNGVDAFGKRNTSAVIYRGNPPVAQSIALENASLASQAVSVPVNDKEMSCAARTWQQIGRRLLRATPLAYQAVASTDGVLSTYAGASGRGLNTTYDAMVRAAFAADLWNSTANVTVGGQSYSQAEANFALFFGLALQMYQSTLVSNDAPIDRYFAGYPSTTVANAAALTATETQGLNLFLGKAGCVACHSGPQLTNAGTPAFAALANGVIADRMFQADGQTGVYDFGFYNIGVRGTPEDLGLGGTDAFGNPLSFARQAVSGASKDTFSLTPCAFSASACTPVSSTERVTVDGAFKAPTLRNVALTGPYFHDGSLATLEDVVQFYVRRGNARTTATGDSSAFGANTSNLAGQFPRIELSAAEAAALVQFLRTALTDDRVAFERAPFDHPELPLVEGTDVVLVPAVGNAGRTTALRPFADLVTAGSLGYTIANLPPVVLSPGNQTTAAGAVVNLQMAAIDPEGAAVTFSATGLPAGLSIDGAGRITGTASTAGTSSVTVTGADPGGNRGTASFTWTVTGAANSAPSVSISSPAAGATFAAPATITINASASDPNNNLARVEFYNGSTLLGQDTTAPFSFTWSNVAAGSYTITAKAVDAGGLSAQASVTVTVSAAVPASFTSTIVNVNSGKCLDIFGASTAALANVIQWGCHGGTNQSFRFNLVAGTASTYTIAAVSSNLCLDVYGGSTASGAKLIQYGCHGGDNQKFTVTRQSDGSYRIVPVHSGKSVLVPNGSMANGTIVQQGDWTGAGWQKWRVAGLP